MSRPNPAPSASTPWWREGFMWLVLGGPAVVVVAGVATVVIATRGADTLLPTRPVQLERSVAPAMQGRNHAVTPLPAPAAAR